ncbi:MAG: putative NAD-dependent epimerase/dehydratase [Acidobacteriaceae bacterium]|nr:putative NAD-dependent epimerase/dehydratase [Acidobacteriaceae bacterium]
MSPLVGITGAAGLIGTDVVSALRLKNYKVRALIRNKSLPNSEGVLTFRGDICDEDTIGEFAKGCRYLVHLAGIAHTNLRSRSDFEQAVDVNVNGTRIVLSAALKSGVEKAIVVSSAHVYKDQCGIDLAEDAATSGSSFYARTKLEVEAAAMEALAKRMQVVIVRPCLTYGPNARYNLENLMRGIAGRYYFHIKGFNPLRSLLSIENAAAAIVHLLQAGQSGETYNLADRVPVGLVDFVNDIADRMHAPRPRSVPYWLVRSGALPFDLIRSLGGNPPFSSEALKKLTQSFSLNTRKLAATGFQWSPNSVSIVQDMVASYLAKSAKPV